MKLRKGDTKELNGLSIELQTQPKSKKKMYHPRIAKNVTLIYAWLNRRKLSAPLQQDIEEMVKVIIPLLDHMADLGYKISLSPRAKRIGCRAMCRMIDMMQMIYQAMTYHDKPLIQLPYITEFNFKELPQGKGTQLRSLIDAPDFTRLSKKLEKEKIDDIMETLKILPRLDVNVSFYVNKDKDEMDYEIHEGD
jgi:flagellin-specific chaperone FliS